MASAEHRKNMMLRWINQLKKEHIGRHVTRDIFLVPGFRPACFHDDPKKWAGEAFALCVQKKMVLPVDEKRGIWKFFNIHDIPNLEIGDATNTSSPTSVVGSLQEASVDRENEYTQHDEESEMGAEGNQPYTPEPMTEERFKKLPGVSKILFQILKSVYLFVGSSVFRYNELRPSRHGYRNDEKDRSAFNQMITKARGLGIIFGTDEEGNLYKGPRGLGYGKFVPGMIPVEWSMTPSTFEVVEKVNSPKSTQSTVESFPSADPLVSTSINEASPSVAEIDQQECFPSVTSVLELEQLRLENAVLKGQVVVYKEIIGQFINNLRGSST